MTTKPLTGAHQPAPDPRIDLAQLFGYRIWKLAALSGAPVIRLCEGGFGVSRQEWSLLAIVAREGQLTPSDLAAQIGLDRPRASKAIGVLISKQLLRRERAQGGRRRFLLTLTPAGLALVHALYPQVRAVSDRLLEGLDPATRQLFVKALEQLTDHAARVNSELFVDLKANRGRIY